jgi:hypothetical protein
MIKIKSEYKWSIAILSVIGLGVLIFKKIKSMQYAKRKVWDSASEKLINNLHPEVRDKAREFINRAEDAGIKLRVTSGYRTYKEQDALYAKGRTTSGAIVTKDIVFSLSKYLRFITFFSTLPCTCFLDSGACFLTFSNESAEPVLAAGALVPLSVVSEPLTCFLASPACATFSSVFFSGAFCDSISTRKKLRSPGCDRLAVM